MKSKHKVEGENFFDLIGWPAAGYNKDGTPWYLIPTEVIQIELEKLGLLEKEETDEERTCNN